MKWSIGKKEDQTSVELQRARDQREIAKLQAETAKEQAKAAEASAKAEMAVAKAERYRAITRVREKNGGAGARIAVANIPDLPKSKKSAPSSKAAAAKGCSSVSPKRKTACKTACRTPSKAPSGQRSKK